MRIQVNRRQLAIIMAALETGVWRASFVDNDPETAKEILEVYHGLMPALERANELER